jgi:hypothetical protein
MKTWMAGHWEILVIAAIVAALIVFLPLLLHSSRPLPKGTDIDAQSVPTSPKDIRLLIDQTAWEPTAGTRVIQQEIFDEMLAMIGRADSFIYLDLFLWNPWKGSLSIEHRKLAMELAETLIQRKMAVHNLAVIILTDPINRIYGLQEPSFFKEMARAGIPVVFTDLSLLPDSNRLYSPYWNLTEMFLSSSLLKNWSSEPRIANPFESGGPEISVLQFGRMIQFKANHRKVVITGSTATGLEMLVGSLNPADGSSAHSNMAVLVRGRAVLELLNSELELLDWSSSKGNNNGESPNTVGLTAESIRKRAETLINGKEGAPGWPEVKLLTEGAIGRSLVSLLNGTSMGDEVRIALFYLSEMEVIEAIKRAAVRGVSIRLILDPNRDAFGMKKIGIPNRPVAAKIMKLSDKHDIDVRWADTHGEQYHTKSMSITYGHSASGVFLTGSANWTKRNLGNLNLEADLLVGNAPHIIEAYNLYFDTIWNNTDGLSHTVPYENYRESGLKLILKNAVYQLQEQWGAGTF